MNTTNYYSMGIDAHKQFCQIHILHPDGSDAYKGRINQCDYRHRFAEIVSQYCTDCRKRPLVINVVSDNLRRL